MKQITYLIINSSSLAFALVMNSLSGSRYFNGLSVGDISQKYDTLFTPAGYAFAIWGLIYLGLVAFIGFQWYEWLRFNKDENLKASLPWFTLANLANGFWIYAWLSDSISLSLLFMIILLVSLIQLTIRLRLEIWDAPVRIIAFVWWPVCIYLGWIIVATVANVAAFLVSIGWNGEPLPEQTWVIIMILAGTLIYALLIRLRNMREAVFVGVWAFAAIAVRQWDSLPVISYTAIVVSLLLVALSSFHALKNRDTLPYVKMKRGEI